MKLKSIANNQTELEYTDGLTVFYSYSTPVAVFVPGEGAKVTTEKFSPTTSKHISQCLSRWGCSRINATQEEINNLADRKGI